MHYAFCCHNPVFQHQSSYASGDAATIETARSLTLSSAGEHPVSSQPSAMLMVEQHDFRGYYEFLLL